MGHVDTAVSLEHVCGNVKHNVGYVSLGRRGRSFTQPAHFVGMGGVINIEIRSEGRMRSHKRVYKWGEDIECSAVGGNASLLSCGRGRCMHGREKEYDPGK